MKKFFLVLFSVGCFVAATLLSAVAEARVTYRTRHTETVVHKHVHEHVYSVPQVQYVQPSVTYVQPSAVMFSPAPVVVQPRLTGGQKRAIRRQLGL